MLPVVYTLPNGAAFTYHDNGNLMGRKLGLRVRQPHGLAKDVDAAGFFGVEARSSGFGGAAANATMYVAEKMHLAPFSSLLGVTLTLTRKTLTLTVTLTLTLAPFSSLLGDPNPKDPKDPSPNP